MSVVQSYINFITDIYNREIGNVLRDPGVVSYNLQQVLDNAYRSVWDELILTLRESFDTGAVPASNDNVGNETVAFVQAIAYGVSSQYRYNATQWFNAYNWYSNRKTERTRQQQQNQQYAYQQPQQQTYSYGPPNNGYGPQNTVHQNLPNNGTSAFVNSYTPPDNANNLGVNSMTTTQPQGNNNMRAENHLPEVTNTTSYTVQTEQIVIPDPIKEVVETGSFPKFTVLDKTGRHHAAFANVFATMKESLSKPVIVDIEEEINLPVYNPSTTLIEEITTVMEAIDIDSIFEELQGLSQRSSINGLIGWLDTRVSRLVEMIIRHRFGNPIKDVCKYRQQMHVIDGWIESKIGKGASRELHDILSFYVCSIFKNLQLEDILCADTEKPLGNLLITTLNYKMLTLPWKINYRFSDGDILIDGVSKRQLNDILDQAYSIMDDDRNAYVKLVDIAGNSYTAFRKGNPKVGGADWFIEPTLY